MLRFPLEPTPFFCLLSAVLGIGCGAFGSGSDDRSDAADENTILRYGDKELDIRRLVGTGSRSISFMVDGETDDLYWVRKGLRESEIAVIPREGGRWTEDRQEVAAPFGDRSFATRVYHGPTKAFYFLTDENLNEAFNVHRFDIATRKMTQVTHAARIGGFSVTPGGAVLYGSRVEFTGEDACIEEQSLAKDGKPVKLFCGEGTLKPSIFVTPVTDAADGRIAFTLTKDGSISNLQLGIYRRDTQKVDVVSDASVARAKVIPVAWRGDALYFVSDEGTKEQALYVYDDTTRNIRRIAENPLGAINVLYDAKSDRFMLNPFDSILEKVVILDAKTEKVTVEMETKTLSPFFGNNFRLSNGTHVISASRSGVGVVAAIDPMATRPEDVMVEVFEPEISKQILPNCEAEKVEYETFDTGNDGKPRKISATLIKPAIAVAEPAAFVYAHGGPSFQFHPGTDSQLLCHLGYYVLGPDVRGSTGQGAEFEQLNNGDWGGGDYLDYEFARRFVEKELGVAPDRIGLIGHSYGGYMTNWAMTRKDNGFAFGVSMSGLSDLLKVVNESSVKDAVTGELGDPASSEEIRQLYIDRSPATHAANVSVPLVIIHGDRDSRTPATQSSVFAETLEKLGKDVTYVEIAGEGHFFQFIAGQMRQFQAILDIAYAMAPVREVATP